MENLGVKPLFNNVYNNSKILVTGHTGFKGSWLVFWLQQMGADVCGYSLAPDTHPNHFSLLGNNASFHEADIRDALRLKKAFQSFQPDIVFHLAAQSLVRRSYREPLYTLATNVMGTANVLEACRTTPSVRAAVIVTSDKCYRNNEWEWGYRENDPMGGHDPYSASKGCAELVTAAFRASFFNGKIKSGNPPLVATARAGNVIGGGDWAEDRLVPDVMRAASRKETVTIRNPDAIRPWQHVLEPLSGYLLLGQRLLENNSACADAWNFGPADDDALKVREVIKHLKPHWEGLDIVEAPNAFEPHEAKMLTLDSSMARQVLGWRPVWDCRQALEKTAKWYQSFYNNGIVSTGADLTAYIEAARSMGVLWAK